MHDDYETKVLAPKVSSANLIVRDFQTADQVAVLRLATDTYINAQTTMPSQRQFKCLYGALLLNRLVEIRRA